MPNGNPLRKERQAGRGPAWIVLAGIVVGLAVLGAWVLRRTTQPYAPATQVEDDGGWPRTLVERFPDGKEGRRLVLPAPPQRIVSVTLVTDEILLDMIRLERIVALSDLAPTAISLIADRVGSVQHFVGADVESIIALEPDLCFLASYNREETRSLLVDSGIPVRVLRCFDSLSDVRDNVRTVGRAVGADEEAERMVGEMDRKLAAVAQRLPSREQWPTALAYGRSGWVAGAGTVQTSVLEAAGLRNAAAEHGMAGFLQISGQVLR
jgi:iron complex transport system substrate-binding protein